MKGEVVYLCAYDVAYEANLAAIEKGVLGGAERFRLGRLKDAPRNFPVYSPLTIQLEDMQVEGPKGPAALSIFVKIFSVGAVSVQVRIPVSCQRLTEMAAFRDLRFKDNRTLDDCIRDIVGRVFESIKPHLDTPVAVLEPPEVYTIFCLNTPLVGESPDPRASEKGAGGKGDSPIFAEAKIGTVPLESPVPLEPPRRGSIDEWLADNERELAALLDGETDPARLSEQEVHETTKYKYSYYQHDLAVVEWDAAFLMDTPEAFQDTLYVLEVANLQLAELTVYDAKLDSVLDKAYDDVEAAVRLHAFRERQRVLAGLREIRMDLTEVADELSNTTKFFGDWHLARIYMGCAARFHLAEWEGAVGQKLRALDGLYTILQQDSVNRLMIMLEVAVVALFVIDLVIIVVLGIK